MYAKLSLAASASSEPHATKSVFGSRPAQVLVKEVVAFPPAPDMVRLLEAAQQRLAEGKSIFSTSSQQPKVEGSGG
jgi:hypothetical protein